MAITTKNRKQLRAYFVKNAIPTEANFRDLIDAQLNQAEDGVFRLPGEPLSVVAAPGAQRRALRLYATYPAANPDWQISLNPAQRPDDPATARAGFGVADGANNTRLFIDAATGNLGVGTTAPEDRLTVRGGDLRVEGDGYHRLKILATNAGVELVARNPGGTPHIDFTQGLLDNPDFGVRLIATDNRTLHLQSGQGPAALHVQGELAVDGPASIAGDLTISGAQSKLDVREGHAAVIRAADLLFGHSARRGAPGRALVDGKESLHLNFGRDWARVEVQGATAVHEELSVGGRLEARGGVSVLGAVAHIEADGALYRNVDGQVYLTVDDLLYIRDQGADTWAAEFQTDRGNLNLKGHLSASTGVGVGTRDPTGALDVRVAGGGGWDRLVVTASDAWGNGNHHVTIGSGGAAGIMIHNPHVSWFAGEKRASIRYGLSAPNKQWWDVGLREDDGFSLVYGDGTRALMATGAGDVVIHRDLALGGKLSKLDVQEQGAAQLRAHDLMFGHSGRRGSPGRALVDGKEALILNFAGDWARLEIHSPLTVGSATTIHGPLTVGGATTIHGPLVVGDAQVNGALKVNGPVEFKGAATLGYATHITDLGAPVTSGFYQADNPAGRVPDTAHAWVHLLALRHANAGNHHQLQLASSYAENDRLFFRKIARALDDATEVPWNELATVNGGVLRLGSWSLIATGDALTLRCGDKTIARFSPGRDRIQLFRNCDGKSPYFYYNDVGDFGRA